MKRFLAATATAAIALTGTAFVASPAQADPVVTGGLVNVTIDDVEVLNNNDVNVGVGVAASVVATICDANVGGILGTLRDVGSATCQGENGETVVITRQLAG